MKQNFKIKSNSNLPINILANLIIGILVYWNIFISPIKTYASISSNENWTIQVEEVGLSTQKPVIDKPEQNKFPEKPPPGTYIGKNYQITASVSDSGTVDTFTFGISNSIIDYGILLAANPIYRTSNILISNYEKKFMVTVSQDKPLSIKESQTFIPDTTCDTGYCTQIRADLWENTLTYGLGYRCDNINGKSCPVELSSKNYYKQFSDFSNKEQPQIIMSNNSKQKVHEAQITYKLNISKNQPEGSYSNTITYIASPGY